MSDWWSSYVTVVGDMTKLREFQNAAPGIFNAEEHGGTCEIENHGGRLTLTVVQRYRGAAAIEEAIEQHRELLFLAVQGHDSVGGSHYWGVAGKDGVVERRKYDVPPEAFEPAEPDRTMTTKLTTDDVIRNILTALGGVPCSDEDLIEWFMAIGGNPAKLSDFKDAIARVRRGEPEP